MVSIDVKLQDLGDTMRQRIQQGFAPLQANAYNIANQQYFTIVHKYVGIEEVGKYQFYTSIHPMYIDNIMKVVSKRLKPLIVVPYTVYGRPRVLLVLRETEEDIVLATEKTRANWQLEDAEFQRNGYTPISIRLGQNNEIYTIYKKHAHSSVTWDLTYVQLINYIYRERLYRGNNAVDITYEVKYDGSVRYIITQDRTSYGNGNIYVDIRFSGAEFLKIHNILRSTAVGYHLTAVTPILKEFPNKVGFVGLYWH